MDIAVIGSNMIDLVTYIERMPKQGETLEAPQFSMGHGGKGANQAIAAGRLGSEVLMLTRVGNDSFGDATLANFERNAVSTEYVLRTEASSGVAPIFVDKEGHNSILIIKGANDLLSPLDIDAAAHALREVKLIVLQLEIPLETVYAAIDFGKAHGIPVLLNPAPAHPSLDISKVKDCDYFMPNESELELLTGMSVQTLEQVEAAARRLLEAGVKNIIVTLGSRGALWINKETRQIFPATPVHAVDTTGAGDAFIGCFSHFLVQTGDVEQALIQAGKYAADSVTKKGTQTSYATLAEFETSML